jgi:NADPH:quinone reductase-like Zn-dependent oxidoreductase
MDAAILSEPGTPRFGQFDEPSAGDGTVVVDVAVAGLNPIDVLINSGANPAMLPPMPSVAGLEGVGTTGGRRVYFGRAVAPYGSMAQRALVEEQRLFDVPNGLDDGVAAALGIAGLAAWLPLSWRAKLEPGETVLVLGATGVLGTIAVQAAKLLGAGRVVGAGRNPDGLRKAAERGADATVDLDAGGDVAGAIKEAADGAVDVIIDALWGDPALAALEAAAPFARLVQIGNSASPQVTLAPSAFRNKAVSILGYTTRVVPLADQRDAYERMARHASAGDIVVDVERVPLRDVEAAWERQAAFPHHKLVLVP